MKKIINTKAAPAAIGPYSQGVSFGNLVMTSGQLPLDPTTMAFPEGTGMGVSMAQGQVL